ncbi:hypothetical protein HDU80_007645 [Chytriomyces hyalinus]|nr:hypothetical protein HDU80_007645 [Chytriomyces hyalinus]
MSLECFLQSASSETDFQSILTMELEEMRTAECLAAVCLYDESGGDVSAGSFDEVSGFLRAQKTGSMRRESMSDESLSGDDDSPRTVVMDDDLEAHELIMDPESNSLLMRRESAVGILESMQFSAMDELLRHGDSSKQHVRGVALATVADSKELRLLESFHSKETNIDDVICLLEGKSVPASGANVDDEETWMDNVWPSIHEDHTTCVAQAASILFGILFQQIISVGLAYVRFLILVKKQKVTVPWAIRFIIFAVLVSLVVIAIPVGIFNKESNLLILRQSDAFCTLDWRIHSQEQLLFLIPSELLFITALIWIPYGYIRICNIVKATFSQLDLSQSHVIQTNESGVFQPELSRRESIQYSSARRPVRRQSMLGTAVAVVGESSPKDNVSNLQRRRSISNAGYSGRPSMDRRRRMSAQISATVQLPEVKEMREGGGGEASMKRSAALPASPVRLVKVDFSESKESVITIDKANASQKSLDPLHTDPATSKSREFQSPAEKSPDQHHREAESQSVCAQETTLQAETAKSVKSLNLSLVSVAESFTRSGFQAKSLASIAQEVSFSHSSSILPPVPAQITSPTSSIAKFGSPGPSIVRISLNPSPKSSNMRDRPGKTSLERTETFTSHKPSFLSNKKTAAHVATESAKRQKAVWTQSMLIVLAYVMGWTPYFVLLLYEAASGTAAPPEVDFVSMFMIVMWGAVNPVLVWFFDPEIRSTVSKSVAAVFPVRAVGRRNTGDMQRGVRAA